MSFTLSGHPATDLEQRGLRRLVGTLGPDAFLRDYIGEQMLYASGPPDRWADLFGWQDLDALLNSGLIPHPRMRLIKDGANVDVSAYTTAVGDRQWPDSVRAQRLMAGGATLVVQNVERSNPKLDSFTRSLQRDLRGAVRVDVVATFAPVPGLRMHWDSAECFNLQIDGEKEWQVVRPERPHPLAATTRFPLRQDVVVSDPPAGPPTWTGVIRPGDLMYLPRGWWHTVAPHVTPSLHLSIAVELPTLTDLLRWFAQRAAQHESARRSLPVWEPIDRRRSSGTLLLAQVAEWMTPEVMDEYLEYLQSSAPPHPDFHLPVLALPGTPALHASTRVRLRVTAPLDPVVEDGWLTFHWRGQRYRYGATLAPALAALESRDTVTIDELEQHADRTVVRAFVLSLITCGLVAIGHAESR